jgi:hypothetical protein
MNLVHHNPVDWNSTIQYIKEALERERNVSLPFISFQEWVAKLATLAASANNEQLNSTVRHLPFLDRETFLRVILL